MKSFGIDFFKMVAIAAVVLIHVFSFYHYDSVMVMADQATRFCVPLFVALSGFGLMLGYGQKKINLWHYLSRRVTKLLPWYLFFATVIILAVHFVFHENEVLYPNSDLWRLYVFGRADFHLYFVPMIVQLYLLFPILAFLFRKFRPGAILLLAFAWQIFWYFLISSKTEILGNNNRVWPDQQQYVTFASWLFYFVLGMYLAKKENQFSARYIVLAILVMAAGYILAATDSLGLIAKGVDVLVATRFTRLPVLLYASGTVLLCVNLLPFLSFRKKLGNLSYLVFLSHTLVLRFFFRTINLSASFGLVPMAIVIISTSFALAAVFETLNSRIYEKFAAEFHR